MRNFPTLSTTRRVGPLAQAALIKAYKITGLVALTVILVGLLCFLGSHAFYLVNRSWIRPQVLSATHPSVLSAMGTLSQESSRRDELIGERDELKAELQGIEKILEVNARFEEEFAAVDAEKVGQLRGAQGYEALVARRAYSEAVIEREKSAARKEVVIRQIARLDKSIARYDKIVQQIQDSAYIQATEKKITVAFVPYENLDNVQKGMPVYACKWGLLWCGQVGTVGNRLKGEVKDSHPQSGADLRGVMVEIRLTDKDAAEERALFVGKRPFWIL